MENLWGRLKEWRAVATRYEKTAGSYVGGLHLAAALDWIKRGHTERGLEPALGRLASPFPHEPWPGPSVGGGAGHGGPTAR